MSSSLWFFMMTLITAHIIMNRGIMRKELGLLFG